MTRDEMRAALEGTHEGESTKVARPGCRRGAVRRALAAFDDPHVTDDQLSIIVARAIGREVEG